MTSKSPSFLWLYINLPYNYFNKPILENENFQKEKKKNKKKINGKKNCKTNICKYCSFAQFINDREPNSKTSGTFRTWPSISNNELVGVQANFQNIVDKCKKRCKRKCWHKKGHKSKLDNCKQLQQKYETHRDMENMEGDAIASTKAPDISELLANLFLRMMPAMKER